MATLRIFTLIITSTLLTNFVWASPVPLITELLTGRRIHVQGHRGARAHRPENTLAAVEYALEQAVDMIELDVLVTADNVVVVHHDFELNAAICTSIMGGPITRPITIRRLTRLELDGFDCGRLANKQFPNQMRIVGTTIPNLIDVLEFIKRHNRWSGRNVGVNIELKSSIKRPDATPGPSVFAALVLEALDRAAFTGPVTLQSFDYRILDYLREENPEVTTAALTEKIRENLVRTADEHGADIVSPVWWKVNPWNVRALRERGVAVVPWTANKRYQWWWLRFSGVDGIITDDPAACMAYLGQNEGTRNTMVDPTGF